MSDSSRIPIQQLDELTIDQIAAGEVVERPAQVVKELVENSIDSGCKKIRIEIVDGGFSRISVIDDGHGIPKDELKLAIKRHATSKISSSEDLRTVVTKGFRGEALASIAAVSKMTLSSKVRGSEGFSLTVDNGLVEDIELIGIPPGTKVDVQNLFQKIPARLSFQRRPSTENAAIVDIAISLALSESKVGILVEIDGRKVLDCPPCDSMEDRLYDLFGTTSSKLVPLESSEVDNDAPGKENWNGWISPPGISRSRSDDIHVLVNGRPVNPGPFLQSIRRGYHTRLMVGRHPIGVLSLNLPTEEVDVNVHPTKREVRLQNSWRVLERLERSIKYTLSKISTEPEFKDLTILEGINVDINEDKNDSEEFIPSWVHVSQKEKIQTHFSSIRNSNEKVQSSKPREEFNNLEQQTLPGLDSKPISPSLSSEERKLHRFSLDGESVSPVDEPQSDAAIIPDLPKMNVLSQFSDSYILAEGDGELFIVDQHALHERIRYERLRPSMVDWSPQELINPVVISVGARELSAARSNSDRLLELGIRFTESDRQIVVESVPDVLIGESGIVDFIHDILIDISSQPESRGVDTVEKLRDKVAFMKSCRGSVKANQELNLAEMRRLLLDMRTVPNPWACVHGRPTILKLSQNHLDKHFGRHG
ncbi:MAG: DNA mismatch repair endonuclease MutL [Candidatus Thalassarchaeaceae archaeon]|nr:DNA mismatch repair endonuclease MutL [Candidatus Thalassarchaeaceae archaeon]